MRKELEYRRLVVKILTPIHAVPIESIVGKSGVPDVNTTLGWIEMKWLPEWPARADTAVRFEFRPAQRDWIAERIRRGGRVALLLIVDRDWLVTSGANLPAIGYLPKAELCYMCTCFSGPPSSQELITCLAKL